MECEIRYIPVTIKGEDARRIADFFKRLEDLPKEEREKYPRDDPEEAFITGEVPNLFKHFSDYIAPENIAALRIPKSMLMYLIEVLRGYLFDDDKKDHFDELMPEGSSREDFRKLWKWFDVFAATMDLYCG